MRPVTPMADSSQALKSQPETGWAIWLHISIPMMFFKEHLRIDLSVSGRTGSGSKISARQRRLARAALFGIMGLVLVLAVSGVVFLLYLVKSALGIDIFTNDSLLG